MGLLARDAQPGRAWRVHDRDARCAQSYLDLAGTGVAYCRPFGEELEVDRTLSMGALPIGIGQEFSADISERHSLTCLGENGRDQLQRHSFQEFLIRSADPVLATHNHSRLHPTV